LLTLLRQSVSDELHANSGQAAAGVVNWNNVQARLLPNWSEYAQAQDRSVAGDL
jgi:hypothetical protein